MYRCEAQSVEAFVQQIAVSYILHGYFYFVMGRIPFGKDCRAIDEKLIARYGLDISKWTRCRRLKEGIASLQYLRHRNVFVLAATEGNHRFFQEEASVIYDIRFKPLQCFGYAIECYERDGKWHPSVKIEEHVFFRLKKLFRRRALRDSSFELAERMRKLSFAPFAPVRAQYLKLLCVMNRRRKRVGLPLVPGRCVRRRRKPVQVFARCTKKHLGGFSRGALG